MIMCNWDKILDSHSVRLFRNVAYEWWGLDVHFYDKFGNYKKSDVPLRNSICALMQTRNKTANNCLMYRIDNLKDLHSSCSTIACNGCENQRVTAVSITVKGDHIGSIVCSGMLLPVSNSFQEQSIRKMTRLGFDKAEVKQSYDKLQIAHNYNEDDVLKLMKVVARDVSCFYKSLTEEMETKSVRQLHTGWKLNGKYKAIIGNSISLQNIFSKLELIENSVSPVLIGGETGTGKELIASAIHYNSILKDKAFVIQNCSTFNDEILSSELFGHEKGSFTGAVSEKKGIFEVADGGTLFLDEIGDISLTLQGKLLRVLENGTFYRVGGTEEKRVNVRLITATNKDLTKLVEEGLFRKDLLYRINHLCLTMAPLRERKEDIAPLFHSFLEYYTKIKKIEKRDTSLDLIKLLAEYNWPGNIRELKNVVESSITMSGDSKSIEPEHLPPEIVQSSFPKSYIRKHAGNNRLQNTLKFIDKEITEDALQKAKWNKTVAARELGISRASLNNRINKFNLQRRSL